MIAYLSGKLVFKEPSKVIIECGGIGYSVRISLNTFSALKDEELVKLHTYFMVKEDSQTLFGFLETKEKALFEQLIGISGVGGNTAITILSSISPGELERAIDQEDINLLKSVKGIGAKTAARIILELKGKLKLSDDGAGPSSSSKVRQEAMAALSSLGFSKSEVEKRVDEILRNSDGKATVEEIIKLSLKK